MNSSQRPGSGIDQKLLRGLAVIGVSLVASAAVAIASSWTAVHDMRGVARSYDVLETIAAVLHSSLDSQSGTRGFVITGDEAFLEHQRGAETAARMGIVQLGKLLESTPSHREQLERLENLVEARLRLSRATVEIRRLEGFDEAQAFVKSKAGKEAMDGIRGLCSEMTGEERRLLAARREAAHTAAMATTAAMGLLTLLVLVSLGVGYAYVRRDLARRAESEAQILRLNEDLQNQVARAEALAEERDRFFNSSRDIMAIAGTDGLFKRLNPAWEKALGWPEDEARRRPYIEFVHPEDRDSTIREARGLAEGRETVEFENRYLAKDGSYRWISWNARLDRHGGSLIHCVGRDVSDRRKAEQELRQARDALEIANRELDAFSYSVSHDLRAPLRGIHGFSQAILQDNEGKFDAETEANFRRVQGAAKRMGQLVDDLLMLSRITRAEMVRQEVNLSALAVEVASGLREGDPRRQADIVVEDGLKAEGDPRLLRVVLENLLGNAWKFTSKLPRASIEVGAAETEGEPRFFVRDNGAGFDMTYARKLFGVFQRLHGQSEFPGTGIGLATVARVIHRHGGRVWAEAAEGRGATFWFTLPMHGERGGSDGEQATDPAGG